MIYKGDKAVTLINKTLLNEVSKLISQKINKVYYGTQLIWVTIREAIKSCFGSGTWLKDKPWLNDDYWKK